MDSNTPQSVAEMLEMLKTSVDQPTEDSDAVVAERRRNVSEQQMQKELKKLYLSANLDYDAPEDEDIYVLDDDFLREINGDDRKKRSGASSHTDEIAPQVLEMPVEDVVSGEEDLAPWEEPVLSVCEEAEIIEKDEIIEEDEVIEEDEIIEED